jgi:hypothetical protein
VAQLFHTVTGASNSEAAAQKEAAILLPKRNKQQIAWQSSPKVLPA